MTDGFIGLNFANDIFNFYSHIGHFVIIYFSFYECLQHSRQILSPQQNKLYGDLSYKLKSFSHDKFFLILSIVE